MAASIAWDARPAGGRRVGRHRQSGGPGPRRSRPRTRPGDGIRVNPSRSRRDCRWATFQGCRDPSRPSSIRVVPHRSESSSSIRVVPRRSESPRIDPSRPSSPGLHPTDRFSRPCNPAPQAQRRGFAPAAQERRGRHLSPSGRRPRSRGGAVCGTGFEFLETLEGRCGAQGAPSAAQARPRRSTRRAAADSEEGPATLGACWREQEASGPRNGADASREP